MEEFDVKAFLYEQIGLEEPRVRRRNFFEKLIRLVKAHGLPVVSILAEAWHESTTRCKRSTPQRMFCRIVKLRLIEAKLWHEERAFEGMSLAEILKTGIFTRHAPMPLFEGSETPKPREGHHPACQRKECKGCK